MVTNTNMKVIAGIEPNFFIIWREFYAICIYRSLPHSVLNGSSVFGSGLQMAACAISGINFQVQIAELQHSTLNCSQKKFEIGGP